MMRNITVGIDVGTQVTRVIVGEYRGGENRPVILGLGSAESRGLRHGYVVNRNEAIRSVSAALKEAERASKVKIRRAFASLGGVSLDSATAQGAVAITKGDGEVTELDLRRAIKESELSLGVFPNRKVIHVIPMKWKLDGKEIWGRAVGLKGEKLEVKTLFVTCLEQHLNDIVDIIEENGVEVVEVVASPLAAALISLTKRQKTEIGRAHV